MPVFGYAASYDLNNVPYAVLDQDRTSASRDLLAKLDGSGVFNRVADLRRADDIAAYINDQRALLVIQIDQEFERRLFAGMPANVQVIADGRNSNTAGTAMGYVQVAVDAFNANWRADHGLSAAPTAGRQPRLVQSEPGNPLVHGPGADRDAHDVADAAARPHCRLPANARKAPSISCW